MIVKSLIDDFIYYAYGVFMIAEHARTICCVRKNSAFLPKYFDFPLP